MRSGATFIKSLFILFEIPVYCLAAFSSLTITRPEFSSFTLAAIRQERNWGIKVFDRFMFGELLLKFGDFGDFGDFYLF